MMFLYFYKIEVESIVNHQKQKGDIMRFVIKTAIYWLLADNYSKLKFLLAGLFGTIAQYLLVFIGSDVARLDPTIWFIFPCLVGQGITFALLKFWVFLDGDFGNIPRQVGLYFFVIVTTYGVNEVFIYIGVNFFHVDPIIPQVVSSLILTVVNYLPNKMIFAVKPKPV